MVTRLMRYGALAKAGAIKHSTGLLVFGTCVGLSVSGYLWFRAGMKTTVKLSEREDEKGEELTKKEKAKVIARESIAPATVSALTLGMVIASGIISIKKQKALSAALALSTEAMSTYRDKVVETLGEKKEAEMRGDIARDELRNDIFDEDDVYNTGTGNTLFKDGISKQKFRASIDHVREQQLQIVKWYGSEDFISVNEWYGYLGIEQMDDIHDYIGWSSDHWLDFELIATKTQNGTPCLMLDYTKSPPSAHPDLKIVPNTY